MSLPTVMVAGLRFVLEPHGAEEPPAERWQHLAYVAHDDSGRVKVAQWKNGQWLDHRKQPFERPVVRWYSMRPDDA